MSGNREILVGATGLLVGFACGVGLTLLWLGGPEEAQDPVVVSTPAPSPAPSPASAPAPPPEPRPSTDGDRSPEVAALLTAMQAANDPLSGPPPEWPEPSGYLPDAVRASLESAFPGTEIRLECSEFPCIGVIETGPEVPEELAADLEAHWFPKEAYGRVGAQLEAMGLDDADLSVTQRQPEEGGHRFLVSWLTSEQRAEIEHRLQARMDWLAEHGLDQDRGVP